MTEDVEKCFIPPLPALPKGRLVVTGMVYCQPAERQPFSVNPSFGCHLDSEEQPYLRQRFAVGNTWQPLDTGWIKDCCYLVLLNDEGTFRERYPSEAEKAETAARIVELSLADDHDPFALVQPGRSCQFEPVEKAAYVVRCRRGTAYCTLLAVPR